VIYCIGEYSFVPHKVVWLEQQDPSSFRCSVVGPSHQSLLHARLLVPDHKLYFLSATSSDEAHYAAAYLNSHPVRAWLGGFLHGKQIGTTIFEFMKMKPFDANNTVHQRLVRISQQAHKQRDGLRVHDILSADVEQELSEAVRQVAESQ